MAGYIGNKAVGLNVTTGDILGDVGVGGVVTANAGVVVDEMTLDADTLTATDTFTVDAEGIITLDSNFGDGAIIRLADGGTQFGDLFEVAGDFLIASAQVDKDIIFKGNDGGGIITALTLDMSDAGSAIFNQKVIANSSSSGDYVRMYAGSGTGKWDIYGNGANLRFSDNESAGSVVFDRQINASAGIAIGGTGAANTLDDYEEGNFTPTAKIGTLASAYGSYTKVGRLVTICFGGTFPSSSNGQQQGFASLPFSTSSGNVGNGGGFIRYSTFVGNQPYLHVDSGAAAVGLYRQDNGNVFTGANAAGLRLDVVALYFTA